MLQYIVKRVIIMIPTFFVVSIVVFLLLNIAPGRPGRVGQEGVTDASESVGARESYRIFKEQFNLDKPIFLNFDTSIRQDEVEALVGDVILFHRQELPEAERPTIGETIAAQDRLEDLGAYIVPHLYAIAKTHPDPDYRWFATKRLATNAKRRLVNEFSRQQQSAATVANNREIDQENTRIATWVYRRDASEARRAEVMAKWDRWMTAHGDRFDYDSTEIATLMVTDTRFFKYWSNLIHLDFGVSNIDRQPVLDKILHKLRTSLTLSLLTILIIYAVAVPLGVFSAVKQGSVADQVITFILFMLYSLPSFFTGVLLLRLLSIGAKFSLWPEGDGAMGAQIAVVGATVIAAAVVLVDLFRHPAKRTPVAFILRGALVGLVFVGASVVSQVIVHGSVDIFPTGGFETAEASRNLTTLGHLADVATHLVLPVFCLTYGGLASLSRYARSGLLDVIRADYIRTARAKGLSEPVVIIKHAARNGMIPILTLLGTMLPYLIGGSVIIEIVFNIPGMGLFLYESITTKDYNVVMGILLISSMLTLIGVLLSDISYAFVDPRISFK